MRPQIISLFKLFVKFHNNCNNRINSNSLFNLSPLFVTKSVFLNQHIRMSSQTACGFGAWKSPISSKLATESSVSLQEVHVDRASGQEDKVYWCELRVDEGGRQVVCSVENGDQSYTSWTPKEFNSRTRVHEYGGGAFTVHKGSVYFSNFEDQQIYKQETENDAPKRITSESKCRYADAEYNEKYNLLFCIQEDHSKVDGKIVKEPQNTVVCVDVASGKSYTLASGCDFYSCPRVSPDGKKIAWVQWNHPNMPWDTTEIYQANLGENGTSLVDGSVAKVTGGGNDSVIYPSWTPNNELLYISDMTDWWNLYHVTASGEHVNLKPIDKEIGIPMWTFAHYRYDIDRSGSGNIVTVFRGELGILNMNTKEYNAVNTGFDSHSCVQYGNDGNIYCIAGGPKSFSCVLRINSKTNKVDVLRESKQLAIDKDYLSVPRKIDWPSGNGETCHGYFYPPQNKDFCGSEGEKPPLLVKAHGGPTSCASNVLNLKIQYFTSRGFAVLDVDYRGSTGYGKAYRHRLRGNWGVCDIEDASSGAKFLADTGEVDANRLCIDGGSAGGYTTLACLTFTDVFKAGASHYGIGDLEALAAETHKFESRYCDRLLAPFTEANMHIFHERSPIKHIDKFNCAVAFFQGDEDKIVPPNQAEMMFDAVKAKGLPCAYVLFKGEQHGFRKAENIQKSLDGEFFFFSKVFGFEPADKGGEIPVANLPQ